MFEKATRLKLRFNTEKGLLSVEDLWIIPIMEGRINLKDLALDYHKKIKEYLDLGFEIKKTFEEDTNELSFKIIRHIIQTRMTEQRIKEDNLLKKQKKAEIMTLINEKKLASATVEDLEKMLTEL